jgi:hypothetical protein
LVSLSVFIGAKGKPFGRKAIEKGNYRQIIAGYRNFLFDGRTDE